MFCLSDCSDFHSVDQSGRKSFHPLAVFLLLFFLSFKFPASVLRILCGEAVYNYILLVK